VDVGERETIAALMAVPMMLGAQVEGIIQTARLYEAPGDLATCADEGREPSPHAHGLRYALTVPMRAASRIVGTLSFWSGERPYSRADEELATTVAGLLALRLNRPSGR
jgi:hypothetical protein